MRRLFILALLSLAIYLFAFTIPYPLLDAAAQRRPADLGLLSDYSTTALLVYVGALVALYALYAQSLRLVPRLRGRAAWWIVALGGVGAALALLMAYPFSASDVFIYVARARVWGVYGRNPMLVPPNAFPTALYVPFASEWLAIASPYGPLWEWTSAALARLGDGSMVRSLLAFKGWALLTYLGCAMLIVAILRRRAPQRALQGLLAFAWNPLVLLEANAMGHNDLYMILFVLLALYLWQERRYTGVIVALFLGAGVKYVPLALLPPTLLILWRVVPRRVAWRATWQGMLMGGALTALLFAPLWPGLARWDILSQVNRGYDSPGVWLILVLQRGLGIERGYQLGSWATRLVVVALYGLLLWRAWRQERELTTTYYHAFYSWLALGSLAFGYWYITWIVALLPLLTAEATQRRIIVFSLSGLLSVALYTWGSVVADTTTVSLLVIPLVFGLPFLVTSGAPPIRTVARVHPVPIVAND